MNSQRCISEWVYVICRVEEEEEVYRDRMELSNWTIFSLLDKEFAAQIRLACVFGKRKAKLRGRVAGLPETVQQLVTMLRFP